MPESCTWKPAGFGDWDTDCGHDFVLSDPPKEIGWEFCPFCGKPLTQEDEDAEFEN